ncbi:hypothetical protein BN2537_12937 [Streptomyces venezuelae]|nr:hypothetical protein BN2537_12937 [Streptomyces venezuelae]
MTDTRHTGVLSPQLTVSVQPVTQREERLYESTDPGEGHRGSGRGKRGGRRDRAARRRDARRAHGPGAGRVAGVPDRQDL